VPAPSHGSSLQVTQKSNFFRTSSPVFSCLDSLDPVGRVVRYAPIGISSWASGIKFVSIFCLRA